MVSCFWSDPAKAAQNRDNDVRPTADINKLGEIMTLYNLSGKFK